MAFSLSCQQTCTQPEMSHNPPLLKPRNGVIDRARVYYLFWWVQLCKHSLCAAGVGFGGQHLLIPGVVANENKCSPFFWCPHQCWSTASASLTNSHCPRHTPTGVLQAVIQLCPWSSAGSDFSRIRWLSKPWQLPDPAFEAQQNPHWSYWTFGLLKDKWIWTFSLKEQVDILCIVVGCNMNRG